VIKHIKHINTNQTHQTHQKHQSNTSNTIVKHITHNRETHQAHQTHETHHNNYYVFTFGGADLDNTENPAPELLEPAEFLGGSIIALLRIAPDPALLRVIKAEGGCPRGSESP